MSTQGVNGANLTRAQLIAQLEAAQKTGNYAEVSRLSQAILKFDEDAKKGGTEVEQNPNAQPLTEEQQAAKDAAKAQQEAEIAKMKAASQGAGQYASDMDILRDGTEKIKTKEGAQAAGFKNAKKIAKAAKKVNSRIDGYEAVEKIYTNKDEYKKAVSAAKKDGTWDKDNPKYTLLDGKALEGAKRMQADSAKKVDEALKNYKRFEAIYNNPKSDADKQQAFKEMCDAAKLLSENYNASQMFDENGNINKEAYQKTMLQYSGTDLKANLDERRALKESADVSKGKTKQMFKAAGLDIEKDYTWAMRAGTLAVGVGTGALAGLLGGGLAATAVANAVATATASATATATATATGTNTTITDVTASNGEQFIDVTEDVFNVTETATTTVTSSATKAATDVATDAVSKGTMAGRGALAALPAAILSAALVKDTGGKDAFNGLSAEQVLKNAQQVKGKANKELVQKIIDMPNLTTNQKAAILHEAYGDNTGKKVNTEELVAAYTAAKYLDEHPELVTPQQATTGTTSTPTVSTPTVSTPTVSTPTVSTPTEEECHEVETKKDFAKLPIMKYRIGPWYISHGYTYEDGSKLSEADRRALQKELTKGENAIRYSNDDKGKRDGLNVKDEITLPSGKKVKLAPNAQEVIMKLPAKGGGKNPRYNTEKNGTKMRAIDCKTGKPITGWMTPAEFDKWEEAH